jgi:cyclopropane-fatty-acyl-phospholipid synthase
MVFQMQLAKEVDSVPITRDYLVDWEREHPEAAADAVIAAED